ncbi:hypothetical protein PIB30_119241 [Stylosanthes scabra]|uniref:Transposase n=1 Tax=Stylosanthes scabra TaxID=79078 RepID=A0ABU6Y295_9FABA|nr:hypothetical protein [Stylosanthes scabra]
MPRVGRFGVPPKKGGNKPSTQAPPLSTNNPPTANASPPSINAQPISQFPSPLVDAPPPNQTPLVWIDATLSQEPHQPLSATQTWPRRRQRTKGPLQVPPPSVDALPSTQAPPPTFQAQKPSFNAPPSAQASSTPSTVAPSQAPLATQTQLRHCQWEEAPSQAQQPSIHAAPSTQVPPSSFDAPSSSAASSSFEAPSYPEALIPSIDAPPPITHATSASIDVSPSSEAPSQAPPTNQSQRRTRENRKFWTVDVKDASGVTKVAYLKLKNLWNLPSGTKVVLPLNEWKQPVGEAAGLLGQALGQLGANFSALPICYKSWPKVPKNLKEEIFYKIKDKFLINDDLVKKIIIQRIGEKWKENRSEVFHKYYDPELSKEENYANHPPEINRDHWIQFIDYRLDPNTVEICRKNAESREKLSVVHRLGSKSLARKRHEMEVETGEPVSRGKVFIAMHTKPDGSYPNDAIRAVCDEINRIETEGNCSPTIGPDDSLAQALGEEHSGRIRGLGLGPCKTQLVEAEEKTRCGGSCLNSSPFTQMQQEIIDLRERLERETKSRCEFENAVTLVLQHVATPNMTPELATLLTPLITRAFQASLANGGNAGKSNGKPSN